MSFPSVLVGVLLTPKIMMFFFLAANKRNNLHEMLFAKVLSTLLSGDLHSFSESVDSGLKTE